MKSKKNIINFFFVTFHVVLCLDFGFYNHRSRKIRFILKLCSFIQCFVTNLIICIFIGIYYNTLMVLLYSLSAVGHCVETLILIFLNSADTFYRVQSDILLIDSKLLITCNSYSIEFRTIVTIFFLLLCKIIHTVFYCTFSQLYCFRPLAMQALFYVPLTALDLPLIMYYFILRAIRFRLKIITQRLENGSMSIVKCRRVYKSLVMFTDKIKKPFDMMVSYSLW